VQSARSAEQLIESLDRVNERVCAAQLEFLQLVAQIDRSERWRGMGAADMTLHACRHACGRWRMAGSPSTRPMPTRRRAGARDQPDERRCRRRASRRSSHSAPTVAIHAMVSFIGSGVRR